MLDDQMNDTQPVNPVPDLPDNDKTTSTVQPKRGQKWWVVGGIVAVLVITALGALGGYFSGIANRKATENNNRALAASMQYQLGLTDLQAGRYGFAKQRFEYVIELDPGFPGVLEKMAEIAIVMNATATPTPAPIPTAAPTLDLSGVENLLAQSKQFLVAKDWSGAISALDAIRKGNPSFKTLEVDGLYFLALKYRGIEKIYQLGKLESGIYDIALMTRFGPMDVDSRDASEWASSYIYGASWWGVDFLRVVKDLEIVYTNFPNIQDQGHITAFERYRMALAGVGDQLALKGKWCDAVPYYLQSLQVGDNGKVGEAYTKANNKCIAMTPTETPTVAPVLNNDPIITGANLPEGSTTAPYAGNVTASDPDSDPIVFSDISGNLAANGLSMDAAGNISGTPTAVGTINFTVQVDDGRGGTASADYSINVTS
jgi:hypothetical protein